MANFLSRNPGSDPMDPATPRQTGLRVLPTTPWGTHICVFYKSTQDLVDSSELMKSLTACEGTMLHSSPSAKS